MRHPLSLVSILAVILACPALAQRSSNPELPRKPAERRKAKLLRGHFRVGLGDDRAACRLGVAGRGLTHR